MRLKREQLISINSICIERMSWLPESIEIAHDKYDKLAIRIIKNITNFSGTPQLRIGKRDNYVFTATWNTDTFSIWQDIVFYSFGFNVISYVISL